MAIDRVARRVKEGGHNIETEVIRRRYNRGIKNLFEIYIPLVSETMIFDCTLIDVEKIAVIEQENRFQIFNTQKWEKLKLLSRK
jgi:predicted ABC-type ATPase